MVRILLLRFGMSWTIRRGRWQYLIAVFLGITIASQASALGLGEIDLDSALNERLEAEIELLDASGLQPTEIIVSLASNEDFERVGVERFFFLTDLRFEVVYGIGGGAMLSVTSTRAVSEPYLNFVVEILWPGGRLLKEYTLLLDPPTFAAAAPPPRVSAPTAVPPAERTAGRIERTQPTRSSDRPSSRVQLSPRAERNAQPSVAQSVGDQEYLTGRRDTLWTIASSNRASQRVSVQQNMLAIQRLNPNAFIRNNINLLKAGYVLRLPSEPEALSITSRDATQEVATQNEAWRTGGSGTPAPVPTQIAETDVSELQGQVDATARADTEPAETVLSEGQLRIVAGQGNSASGGSDATSSEQVNAALEERDRLTREVDELTYQLDREQEIATSELAVRDRQLQVKDQQIAELQAQMLQVQEQMNELADAQNQNQTSQTSAAPLAWWQSPLVLGGGLGVLVLLLVAMMIMARRVREADNDFYPEPVMAGAEPVVSEAEESEYEDLEDGDSRGESLQPEPEDQDAWDEPGEETAEKYAEDEEDYAEQPAEEQVSDEDEDVESPEDEQSGDEGLQTSDVIGEADIYIAYGRYPQAISLLLGVIDEQQDRNDVRLKLLELYVETNDKDAFNTHMSGLLEHCDDEDALLTAREFESRLGENELAVESPLEGVPSVDGSMDSTVVQDSEDLSADEFHLDLDNEEAPVKSQGDTADSGISQSKSDNEMNLAEFELEIDDFESVDGAEDSVEGELGGDLGIDFDPGDDGSATQPADEAGSPASETNAQAGSEIDASETLNLDDVEFDSEMAELAVASDEKEFSSEVASAEDDDFDFEDEVDSANTKLDLAKAYIDMGDTDGARDILNEVVTEGNTDQQQKAEKLLDSI